MYLCMPRIAVIYVSIYVPIYVSIYVPATLTHFPVSTYQYAYPFPPLSFAAARATACNRAVVHGVHLQQDDPTSSARGLPLIADIHLQEGIDSHPPIGTGTVQVRAIFNTLVIREKISRVGREKP